ncbi:hypothetical protein C7972_101277 [Arenibacter sp. ARW7G5Y1]|nr:hypothetical protein C7972_101277 [Arenibacter sp. ARW7G5Y1]
MHPTGVYRGIKDRYVTIILELQVIFGSEMVYHSLPTLCNLFPNFISLQQVFNIVLRYHVIIKVISFISLQKYEVCLSESYNSIVILSTMNTSKLN